MVIIHMLEQKYLNKKTEGVAKSQLAGRKRGVSQKK